MLKNRSLKIFVGFYALTVTALQGAIAQQGGDNQAQILYAYQTEDVHRLSELARNLNAQIKPELHDNNLRYDLAHTEYRLAQLLGDGKPHETLIALESCTEQLTPLLTHALKQDVRPAVKSAELMILKSACDTDLAKYKPVQAARLRRHALELLRDALKIAPQNPRAVYLMAATEQPLSAQVLLNSAELFEKSPATSDDAPGWGHAEAYLSLGLQLASQGDKLGARNWIEKALIAAPDFKAAQRQLTILLKP